MNSPSHDLAMYLAAQGVGAFGGMADWAVYANGEPANPDRVVVLYDTGGEEPDTDELDEFRPSVQVRVRADDYVEGYAKQEAIRELLIMPALVDCATSIFTLVVMTSDIAGIARDQNERFILVANYRTRRVAK